MYTRQIPALFLILLLIGTCGCSVLPNTPQPGNGTPGNQQAGVPTMPDQYTAAPVRTPTAGSGTVPVPTSQGPLPVIAPAQVQTINGTGLSGGGGNSSGSGNSTTVIPVAQFTSTTATGFAPLTVQFRDTSANLPAWWYWDFGDGTNTSFQNPTHTYTNGGSYAVNFVACNAAGCGVQNAPAYVSVYAPGFGAVPTSGPAPLTVWFTDTGTGTPPASSWYWDFGDGFTATIQNVSHQYMGPGTYTVKFRVSNQAGTIWVNQSGAVTVH